MSAGRIEIISTSFILGWAEARDGRPVQVAAFLRSQMIGVATADLRRPDLVVAATSHSLDARAYIIIFENEILPDELDLVTVRVILDTNELARAQPLVIDRNPRMRVFIFGSPRSGTSELGHTLATQLGLRWQGEGHAAPLLAAAAESLRGQSESPHNMQRFMAEQNLRHLAINATRVMYYFVHASASFVDKTPGVDMIKSAPFIFECFPDAKFIFLRRNGISNVLSRMARFGGNFAEHCADWAASMEAWRQLRDDLPHYLEIEQEDMMERSDDVAVQLARYLGVHNLARDIAQSLGTGRRETTGAGVGRRSLVQTGWSLDEIEQFKAICEATMSAYNYAFA